MTEFSEAIKGFTDIPIALLAFVLGFLAYKKGRKYWGKMLLTIALAATVGAMAHIILFSPLVKNLIWVGLYPLLYESIRRFSRCCCSFTEGFAVKNQLWLYLLEIGMYLASLVTMFCLDKYDILIFAGFASVCFIKTVYFCFRRKNKSPKAPVLLGLIVIPLGLQILDGIIPYAIVLNHISIAGELILTYSMAIEDMSFSEEDKREAKRA